MVVIFPASTVVFQDSTVTFVYDTFKVTAFVTTEYPVDSFGNVGVL